MPVFKYLPRQIDDVTSFAPMLDVVVSHRIPVQTRAYVDSGSSTTYMPRGTARRIGVLGGIEVVA